MRVSIISLAIIFLALPSPASCGVITSDLPANTAIININAVQYGAGPGDGDKAVWTGPFFTGGASALLEYTIPQAGTTPVNMVLSGVVE